MSDRNETDTWGISEPPEIRTPDGELIEPRLSYATGASGNMILKSGEWEPYCEKNYMGGRSFRVSSSWTKTATQCIHAAVMSESGWPTYQQQENRPRQRQKSRLYQQQERRHVVG